MKNILLVEDNKIIANGLEYSLQQEGFNITCKENVKDAIKDISLNNYDLILLDVTLPDGDGFTLCKYIKQNYTTPIIFLTAKDEEKDIVQGLDIGADDYICKPFRMRELISRIQNVLRRYKKDEKKSNIVQIEDVKIDLDKNRVYKKEEEVELTSLEYRILLMMFHNNGKIVTREQILETIWDIAGNFVNDNTLTVYIKRIREKIEDSIQEPKIIRTVRGIGYKIGN